MGKKRNSVPWEERARGRVCRTYDEAREQLKRFKEGSRNHIYLIPVDGKEVFAIAQNPYMASGLVAVLTGRFPLAHIIESTDEQELLSRQLALEQKRQEVEFQLRWLKEQGK